MKKCISIALAVVIIVVCATVPSVALSCKDIALSGVVNTDKTQTNQYHLFETNFQEQYKDIMYLSYSYDEVYYYYNGNDIEWALIEAHLIPPTPMNSYAVLGDNFSLRGRELPFSIGYGVYDCKLEKFIDICKIDDFGAYESLDERVSAIEFLYEFGDANLDHKIDIIDATYIQRVLASEITFPDDDLDGYKSIKGEMRYTSDIDRDGMRTILDATLIQKRLARIEDTVVESTEPQETELVEDESDEEYLDPEYPEPESPTENPYYIYRQIPCLDVPAIGAHFSSSLFAKDKKVYCCLYDKDNNVIGDAYLFSKQHLAVVVAGKNSGIRYADYYPDMRGLELEPGFYMYDFYNADGKPLFRSFVDIK